MCLVGLRPEDAEVCEENAEVLMLEHLSEKFTGKLVHAGIISETDADIYMYGFFQVIMLFLNVITTLLLGVLFQQFFLCILLNATYIPIRISAGGHHANSPFRCYINSTIMIAVLLAVIRWIPIHPVVSIALLVLASIVVWILAPVETENNPLDETERYVYRKRTRIVLAIEIAASVFSLIFLKEQIATTIILGLFTEAWMLLVGAAMNYRRKTTTI